MQFGASVQLAVFKAEEVTEIICFSLSKSLADTSREALKKDETLTLLEADCGSTVAPANTVLFEPSASQTLATQLTAKAAEASPLGSVESPADSGDLRWTCRYTALEGDMKPNS